jgi:hypothetical protein
MMRLSEEHKRALFSYLRSALAAVLAVIAAGDTDPEDILKAAVAALLPPVIRWLNPKDDAFGRVK